MLARLVTSVVAVSVVATAAYAAPLAKNLFGSKREAAALKPQVFGTYSKGCVAGAARLPDDGPAWQAMRPSRNRHWAHPELVELVKQLSVDAQKVGWPGLLVGDLTQPRGGPMLTGHASHQAGLDADIWLTPMPDRRLTRGERDSLSATSVLARKPNGGLNNQKVGPGFTKAHAGLIRTAAQYPNVERLFVHPAIKKAMCDAYPNRPRWLAKVRAQWSHHYHFHIRIGCPAGSPGCRPQRPVPNMGCGKNLDWWLNVAYGPKPKPKKTAKVAKKPVKRKPRARDVMTMAALPPACAVVLNAPAYDGLGDRDGFGRTSDVMLIGNAIVPTWRPGAALAERPVAPSSAASAYAEPAPGKPPAPGKRKLESGFKPAPLR